MDDKAGYKPEGEPQTQRMQVIGLIAGQFEGLLTEIRRVPTPSIQVTKTSETAN